MNYTFNWSSTIIERECANIDLTNVETECLIQQICPQLTDYVVRTGTGIVLFTLIIQRMLHWYLTKGYTRLGYIESIEIAGKEVTLMGDLTKLENRVRFDSFVRHHMTLLHLFFITIIVYLHV